MEEGLLLFPSPIYGRGCPKGGRGAFDLAVVFAVALMHLTAFTFIEFQRLRLPPLPTPSPINGRGDSTLSNT